MLKSLKWFAIVGVFCLVMQGHSVWADELVSGEVQVPSISSDTPVEAAASAADSAPVLKECTFDVAFLQTQPTLRQEQVNWTGLNLLDCSTVKSTATHLKKIADDCVDTDEKKCDLKYGPGVFPGDDAADDAAKWHVRVRQAFVGTNFGESAFAKGATFDDLRVINLDSLKFAKDEEYDADGKYGPGGIDLYNKTIMGWATYYDLEHHTIIPVGQTYVVKTNTNNYAKLQITRYLVNGGGFTSVPEQPGIYFWDPELGPKDGMVHIVIRTVTNPTPEALELK